MTRIVWFVAGWLSLALGIIGAILPLLPSVVFLLMAAFAFSKSSPRFHNWLLTHPTLGPPVVDWYERGAISRKSKKLANVVIFLTVLLSFILGVGFYILSLQIFILFFVILFINTRPE